MTPPPPVSKSVSFPSSTKPGYHLHGCFRCKEPGTFHTCDGWKRHMKEHETVFPCMHCEGTARNPRSFKREANLVKHLIATHGMHSDASAQAERWRKTENRKYFSCGFCVSLFENIADQLNHIDREHFRNLQDISGWNISNVIHGLMLQSGVSPVWQSLFGVGSRSLDFTWNESARNLQFRLELSEESPEVLAADAKSQAIRTEIPQHSDETDQNMLSVQDRATVTPIRSPSADRCPHGHGPPRPDERPISRPAKCPIGQPAKRLRWSTPEGLVIVRLHESGKEWKHIADKLPGRTALAYRNRYWRINKTDKEKRTRLASEYKRRKRDMWTPIANELGIPWRKCEAMHWAIGRKGMPREAKAIPFAIAAADAEPRELRRAVQRDGTVESSEVFEGRDLTPIRSPSVSGCPQGEEENDDEWEDENDEEGEEKDDEGEEEDIIL